MSEHRFRLLEVAMIRRGVAPRHAKRAALELECHHRELMEQALDRDETSQQAEQGAHEALGSDALIVERYASQRELQSWAYRWRAGYVLAPLLGFAGVFIAAIMLLIAISSRLSVLHHTTIPASLTRDMDTLASLLLLWASPVAVAAGFGALAGRQHIALRWLAAGIVVLCMVTASMNVRFILTGGSPAGVVGAGIGFSTGKLLHELLRMLAMAALALIPAGWLRHWVMSRRFALE